MARDNALRGLHVCVVLAAGRGDDHVPNRQVRAADSLAPLTRCLRVRLDNSLSPNRTAKNPNRTDEGLMRTPNRNSSLLEVFRSWLGTMLCVGSTSVWSSLRGEAMTTSQIGKYGPLTRLLLPGVGMLRSFEPHHPPKRPEASLRKAAPAQLYQGFEPVSRLCHNPTSTSVRKQGRLWKHRIAVPRVVSDGVSNNIPRQERV
jgi:hypothetical protein